MLLPRETGIHSLRWRFVVAISALVAVVMAAVSALLLIYSSDRLRVELEQRAAAYASLAVKPVCDAYRTYHDSGYAKFVELIRETQALEPALAALAIYDTEGTRLVHSQTFGASGSSIDSGSGIVDEVLDRARLSEAVSGLEDRSWHQASPDERLVIVAPYIEEWGRHRYTVVFLFSYETVATAMRAVAGQILALALGALVLGVACAIVLARWSLGPVEELTEGARRLAEGQLDHRISLRSEDEFRVLGDTLDVMAARLMTTVDDLERSNKRLESFNEELQELDRLKSDLLANVSHELRTPLTAIGGYVEALEHGILGDLEAEQKQTLAIVERNVHRLRGMIDQLLSFSRMERGKLDVQLAPFAVEPVARHVVEALEAIHGPELPLRIEVAADLPDAYGDAGRIGQVIENLVTNAIKFSPPGAPVVVGLTRRGVDAIEITVRDHGIGIPETVQEQIFDRFYQVDGSSQREHGGMGLGLAIVREILDLHHSTVRVESRPGAGSTFRFALPAASSRSGTIPDPGARRLAIIDDDAGFVHGLAADLSREGWVVDTAVTAEQGLSVIRNRRPDAVLLDRLLPDRDGFDVLTEIKADPTLRTLPVVLATIRRERALGLRLGAAGYLRKPVDASTVLSTLTELLDTSLEPPESGDEKADIQATSEIEREG
ncbi:MAG: ATP-binding protein [Acidobacteriota bacterium]